MSVHRTLYTGISKGIGVDMNESLAKVLFTGGSGLLGSEMKKHAPVMMYPDKREFNVTDYAAMESFLQGKDVDMIVHAAAYTSPVKVNEDPLSALHVNIQGTANVVELCVKHDLKLMYISTDYVFRGDEGNYNEEDAVLPVNKYAWSKLGGECAVQLYDRSLIVRTTFGPNVFPYEAAFVDQWTSRESVAEIAGRLLSIIEESINTELTGIMHVGGDRKTVYEYARSLDETRHIRELSINDVSFTVPVDTSLDCTRYKTVIENRKRDQE